MRINPAHAVFALCLLLIGCSSAGGPPASESPTPVAPSPTAVASPAPGTASPVTTPSPPPLPTIVPGVSPVVGTVSTPAQAAAIVLASDARFADVQPPSAQPVGPSGWYVAQPMESGFGVSVTLGSGDCQAGCIDQHHWDYFVSADGSIELLDERGPAIEQGRSPGEGPSSVSITLVAGPVCPVEQNPPSSACAPRPVAGAEVVLRDPSGAEVARGVSDGQGMLGFSVAGGAYWLDPQPVRGLMRTPPPMAFSVPAGLPASLLLEYDTGIR